MISYIKDFIKKIKPEEMYIRTNKKINDKKDFYKKSLLIKNISNENIVDGVLTIAVPQDVLIKISNVMLISE